MVRTLYSVILVVTTCCFFFFKQKTAYEMRISDWSSDVCSSDLELRPEGADANDLGSDVHVASRHPGAPDATAHKVLGDQRQDRHENQQEEIFHRRSAAGAGDRKAWQHIARWGRDNAGGDVVGPPRSEERRVGKEGGSTSRYRWSQD